MDHRHLLLLASMAGLTITTTASGAPEPALPSPPPPQAANRTAATGGATPITIRASDDPQAGRTHPGQVVDFDRGTPLDSVSANAYATQERDEKGDGSCPTFKERLSVDKSNATGAFKFVIDRATYTATYCKPGFQPRIDPNNKSESNGTSVQPAPVRLMPLSADAPAYKAMVARHISAFLADLRYLQQARPDQFHDALRDASENTLRDPFFAHMIEATLERQNQK